MVFAEIKIVRAEIKTVQAEFKKESNQKLKGPKLSFQSGTGPVTMGQAIANGKNI